MQHRRRGSFSGGVTLPGYALLSAALALAVSGCERRNRTEVVELDLRNSPLATRPGPRGIVDTEWETVWRVGGTESDTTLYDVALIDADSAGVYVYDPGRYQVLRISAEGEVQWAYGGRGKGPDEFTNVRDLKVDPRGGLWILDPENTRVTVLTSQGNVDVRIPYRDIRHPDQLITISHDRVILVAAERERPLYVIDRQGRVIERLEIPWARFGKLHPLAAQMLTAAGPAGNRFALAFRMGNGFFAFDRSAPLPYHGIFVEHAPFPAIERFRSGSSRSVRVHRTYDSAVSLAVGNGHVYVHFGGQTAEQYAVIDIYALATGRYERSLVLPRAADRIAIGRGIVYGMYKDPYPVLEAWRPTSGEL